MSRRLEYTPEFERFWSVYKKKTSKKYAARKFAQALDYVDVETLIRLAVEYGESVTDTKYQKNCGLWLAGKPWNGRSPKPIMSSSYRFYLSRCKAYGIEPNVTRFSLKDLVERHGDQCYYCHGDWNQIEHVIPVAAGGAHSLDNCVPSCSECNYRKLAESDMEAIRAYRSNRSSG